MPPDAPTFISYSRGDSEFALRLAEDLKAAGADVWLDQTDIAPGKRWARAVEEALQNSPRVLVVLSPASVNSHNVEDEVTFALDEKKTVIPILYEECKVPLRLRPLQYVDFRTDYAHGMEILLKTLGVKHQTVSSGAVPKPPRGQTRDTPLQQLKIEVPPADYKSSGKYVFEAHADTLNGKLTEPFREVIKRQGYVQLTSQQAPASNQGSNFRANRSRGYSLEGFISLGSADTRVSGNTSVEANKTTAVAVVRNLELFNTVAADKVTASISIDVSKGGKSGNNVPRISLLGTSFENLRIGGNAVAVDLENGPFEHGRVRLPMSAKDDQQSHGNSSGSLVKQISGSLPSGSVGNAIELPGVGTLFLGELIIDGDSYELRMMRLVMSGGEVRVASCQAAVPRERNTISGEAGSRGKRG